MTGRPANHPRPPHDCTRHQPSRTCYNSCDCRCRACASAATSWRKRQARGWTTRVPIIGPMRRIQALAAMGWTSDAIAAESGINRRDIDRIRVGETPSVNRAMAIKVARLYDRLSMTPPPSTRGSRAARGHALRQGWAPPLAWDEGEIDNPAASPQTGDRRRKGATIEEIAWCIEGGETNPEAIAGRVGIAPTSVKDLLHKAGRHDLVARLSDPISVARRARGRAA